MLSVSSIMRHAHRVRSNFPVARLSVIAVLVPSSVALQKIGRRARAHPSFAVAPTHHPILSCASRNIHSSPRGPIRSTLPARRATIRPHPPDLGQRALRRYRRGQANVLQALEGSVRRSTPDWPDTWRIRPQLTEVGLELVHAAMGGICNLFDVGRVCGILRRSRILQRSRRLRARRSQEEALLAGIQVGLPLARSVASPCRDL